ncbi:MULTISPECIES: DMT family transporter [Oceanobacillus]|uniref:DMT family transporter n=1 Tax=Oceanobacillus profundus TaxID=372463 RepID=A0A417YNS4_9BACI|nr:DMT family transporter [Oceanobacillus profundus]MBR3120358.1 DMT family transporter [Oceanobacillus sp.]MCM3398743.1 DMT family transporter [Oceanobacillus profundus]PAE30644.1 EamA family transporter [Paenibacillus sp. 7884-2]RHW35349.1 DMT family transporter [Oceanobacillus profundus]
MQEEVKSNKKIGIPLVVSIIAISFSAIFVKWSDAPATISSMYRMWFASILLLPFVWKRRKEFLLISKRDIFLLMFSGLFLALHFALWFGSLQLTTVASSTIILTLQPIVALIGGFLIYKERTSIPALLTVGIAVIGAVMVGWGDFGLSREAVLGDILSFLSVIAVVGYLLIGQNVVRKLSHWIYSFCVFLFASITLTIYNLIAGISLSGYESREWGIFLLLAVIPTISHVINNWLLNFVNTTTISMSILGEPVGATALAVLLLGERVNGMQVAGGAVVLIGVFFFLIQQKKRIPV